MAKKKEENATKEVKSLSHFTEQELDIFKKVVSLIGFNMLTKYTGELKGEVEIGPVKVPIDLKVTNEDFPTFMSYSSMVDIVKINLTYTFHVQTKKNVEGITIDIDNTLSGSIKK